MVYLGCPGEQSGVCENVSATLTDAAVYLNTWLEGEMADRRVESCGSPTLSWQGDTAKVSARLQVMPTPNHG